MLDLLCLSLVVYVEARGEPIDGQMLVAEVVINRTQADRYPDDVCGVVFEEDQFSGMDDLNVYQIITDLAWTTSMSVASDVLAGNGIGTTATHYHATHVDPYWSDHLTKLGQYGNHIFYREDL